MASLGNRLRRAREDKRMSQVDVFKKAGINNKTLSRYENNGTEPDADSLKRLAELYEVSSDWLIGASDNKEGALAPPESEIERVIRETEEHYGVNLHNDPVVLDAMRQMVVLLAQAKKNSTST